MGKGSKDFHNVITKLYKSVSNYQEGLARIDREFKLSHKVLNVDQQRNRKIRISNWELAFENEWNKCVTEIANISSLITHNQPKFIEFDGEKPSNASTVPASLAIGTLQISFKQFSCFVPRVIQFPFNNALIFPSNNSGKQLAHSLLLRLLSALPPGQVELTLIDPLQQGQSFEPFLPLLKVKQLVPQGHVLTRMDEIEIVLKELTDEIEEIIQQRFSDKLSNWSEYIANNPIDSLPYKAVVLFDMPNQISEKALWYLGRLCENGPRCGILPIIAIDIADLKDRRYKKFRGTLEASSKRLDHLLRDVEIKGMSVTYLPEHWPHSDVINGYMSRLAESCVEKSRFQKTLPDLWMDLVKGETTVEGIDIPIGWTSNGDTVTFRLGATDSEHHALLAGKTGSGKSNLLHVLIHTLCEKYPPKELDLYLLDYKESTEFNIYAAPILPHARLLATESDPEYGITVLWHLVKELETRARIFKSEGVRDFADYRKSSGRLLPRVLLIVDEFQVLFSENRQLAETAERLLSQLLKQGRSFGIHILLATQTLKGINAQSIGGLITQLGCRIALACSQEDSALILSSGNWAAAELCSPPEGIINNGNGARSGNIKFKIPFSGESGYRRELLQKLTDSASISKESPKTKIYSGASLPQSPSYTEYQAVCAKKDNLLLGEQLTFDATPLILTLTHRPAFNVLFSGYNDQIHDGLLSATLTSLAFASGFDEIMYFNARGIKPGGNFSSATQLLGKRFTMFDDISSVPLQAITDDIGKRRVALIVDGLDSEKSLHSPPAFKPLRPGDPLTPTDLLKRLAEDGPRKGTFVFAFIERWQRCASVCKDLFSSFELRVAYCMNEDDAGSLISGGIGKFKGIEKPNRAIFVNKMTNDIIWFKPYIKDNFQ